jgi:hypothetical protein
VSRFAKGQWNAICDRCGLEFKSSQLRLEWTGLRVCEADWEPRHPQDGVRGKADRQAPPWVRAEPPEINLTTNQVRAEDL